MDFTRPTIFSATIQIAETLSIWAWQSWAVSYSIQCCGNIEMVSRCPVRDDDLLLSQHPCHQDSTSCLLTNQAFLVALIGDHAVTCSNTYPLVSWHGNGKSTLYAMDLLPSLNICSTAEIHRGYQRISSEIDEISVTHRVNVSAHSTQVGMHILLPRFV